MNYLMLYVDTLRQYKRLSDTEFGRAIRAVLQYLEDGTEASLPGKECIMYDVLREQTERDRKSYEKKMAAQRENGSKGGRPRKNTQTQEKPNNPWVFSETQEKPNNPWVFSETQESQKTQEKEKEKEYIPPYNPPKGVEDDEDDLLLIAQQNNAVYDRAKECGFATDTATLDRLTDLIAQFGHQAVLDGLDQCVEYGAKNLAYLRKVVSGKAREEVKTAAREDAGGWLFT